MPGIIEYVNDFFSQLEIWEDLNKKSNHRQSIHTSIIQFINNSNIENALSVYQTFFTAYWIGTQAEQNPFIELIEKMKAFEENAGVLLPKQRDHYVHSVYVFILGISVFSKNGNYRDTFNRIILNKADYKDSYDTQNEEFFYRWGIASLFHDIAYPLEITINQINIYISFISNHNDTPSDNLKARIVIDNLDNFNKLPQILPLPEFSREYKSKYGNCENLDFSDSIDLLAHKLSTSFGIDIVNARKLLIDFAFNMQEKHFIDHGYYSALIVLRWYYYLIQKEKWNPAYFYFPIVDSSFAILLHNFYKHGLMKNPFNLARLSATEHPIAFLLILCDELQDWNRTAYGETDRKKTLPTGFDIIISDNNFELTYQIDGGDDENDYVTNKEKCITSVLNIDNLFATGFKLNIRKDQKNG